MLNYSYNPFKNALEEIDGSDLLLLRDVAEGWYVDYKSLGLKIDDYGKHLAAFANQYGGWLIIGVTEKNDGSRTADKFVGIHNADVEKISLQLREAAASHVNPTVLYEEKIIKGPIEEIELENDKSIIIVGIPRSLNTPHIHSSGRIYRRLADQSKPKEETDRFILDELWKRGNEHQKNVTQFLTQIPRLPEKQSNSTWAHIFFKPSESQLPPKKDLEFNQFLDIVTNANDCVTSPYAPMQAIHTTAKGYVARQIENNDPSLAALAINWFNDGSVRLDIPLNCYDMPNFLETHDKNQFAEEYCRIAYEAGYRNMEIVDFSIFVKILAALSNCYLHMLEAIDDKRDIYSCFTLRNVFYTSPYVDSAKFIERIKKFSLPLTTEQEIVFPQEPTDENMFLHGIERPSSYEEIFPLPIMFVLPIVFKVFNSVGIVQDIETFASDIDAWGFGKSNDEANR